MTYNRKKSNLMYLFALLYFTMYCTTAYTFIMSTEPSTTFSKRRSTATASNAIHYDQSNSLIFHLLNFFSYSQGFLSLEAISKQNERINRNYTYFSRNFVLMIAIVLCVDSKCAPEAHRTEPYK